MIRIRVGLSACLAPLLAVALAACGPDAPESTGGSGGTGGGGSGGGGSGGGPPPKIADQTFGDFQPWAAPIEDYLAVGEREFPGVFQKGILNLAPFGDRMFLGYGDANYNLGGHIPIEMRFFASAEDPAAQPTPIDGEGHGAPQTTPTQSGEEQIDRYRVLDGILWQPGIDSTDPDELWTQDNTDPKGIQGNAYRLDGDTFVKRRTITGGEHVHDLAFFEGAVHGVGSGADTRMEFEAGMIFRYLWRTTDLGDTFETVLRIQHPTPGQGDSRWVHLLPAGDTLYLFGYESDFASNTASIRNASFDGQTVTPLAMNDPLARIFPYGTLALPAGAGIAHGVDISSGTPRMNALHVANGGVTELSSLTGWTLVDVSLADTGEVVYLATEGDEVGAPAPESWQVRVLVAEADAPDATEEIVSFTTDVAPISIAYWRSALFLGTGEGKVLRAAGAPP